MTSRLAAISEAIPELCAKKSLPLRDLKKAVEKCLVWNFEVYPLVEHASTLPAPPGTPEMFGTMNITGVHKATWLPRTATPNIDFLCINSCNDSTIYITSRVRFCLIAGCHECTVIMAAVSEMCTIHNCEKISVHVAARSFKMENCVDATAYLYCHMPPILTGDTRGIKMAPFNVLYSKMPEVLEC